MKIPLIICLLAWLTLTPVWADADKDSYLFSQIDYQCGLSNSAVLCLFQDNAGLMWFGTYDGVNCWDGKTMEVFRSDFSEDNTLSNNVIHSISQADNNCLWISTHLGINRFSQRDRKVVVNYDFFGDYYIHSNSVGNTWILAGDGLYYYNTNYMDFLRIQASDLPVGNLERRVFVTEDGMLWVFPPHTGQIQNYSLNTFEGDSLSVKLSATVNQFHSKAIEDVFYQNGIFCFIDCDKDLYMYDIANKSKIYIRNLSSLMQKYGVIKGIVPFYEDIAIGFHANGLIRLRASKKYEEEIINRNIRIYGIYREPRQGLLWIASDGQGAVLYSKKYSIADNLMLNRMSANLSRQVRSIMTDERGGIWIGTKGDGLLHLPDYRRTADKAFSDGTVYVPEGKQRMASYVKWDKEFHVYKLARSRYMKGFWIGAKSPGLFYYSDKEDAVRLVEHSPAQSLVEVHDIYEENDSVLYVVTVGLGFSKITLEKTAGKVSVRQQKRYHFFSEQKEITMFYPMMAEGDSVLWLGSREKGLVRFNKRTEEYQVVSLKELLHKSVDDVLSLHRAKDGKIYIGTTSGLVWLNFDGKKMEAGYVGREQGLFNDMIHGVLEDDNGFLWLSTNHGLIKYNPKNGSSHDYYYSAGVQIGEFSDDAYYRCPYTGSLFFGGVDGLLYLDRMVESTPDFNPDVLLRRLWIGRTAVNLGDYYAADGKSLQLKGAKVSFSLAFAVPDYLIGEEVEYSFLLQGHQQQWSLFTRVNEVSYTEVPAGDYLLKVRYKKDVFDTEYKYFSIPIRILTPWYRSTWACALYALFLLLATACVFYWLRKLMLRERMLKRLMMAENKKGTSESNTSDRDALNDFTLIYHACDQLRTETTSLEKRREQVELIREITMNALFRPETFCTEKLKHFYPTIFVLSARMRIQELSMEVLRALNSEGMDVSSIQSAVSGSVVYPVYKNALRCILYYSYRFLCQQKAYVTVNAREENGKMLLVMSAAGNTLKGLQTQLTGTCAVSDKEKNIDSFFTLQLMRCFVQSALEQLHIAVSYEEVENGYSNLILAFEPAKLMETPSDKKTILLLEDREELIWLITGLLSEEYTVYSVKSIQMAFDEIQRLAPAAFLVDMSMYVNEEGTFMEYIGKNRSILSRTAFIPLLTWNASSIIQRELIKWSDSYIVFPYDILFLKEHIHKTIYANRGSKQIYWDDLGELSGQIVCTTAEQAAFVRKLLQVIEQNLSEEELGSTLIAHCMSMSSRQFYRKFKEISTIAPGELIKNYRMEKAARLLREEELPIQDVIADVGISSRSYFYKEFARRFGMTPKEYREQNRKSHSLQA